VILVPRCMEDGMVRSVMVGLLALVAAQLAFAGDPPKLDGFFGIPWRISRAEAGKMLAQMQLKVTEIPAPKKASMPTELIGKGNWRESAAQVLLSFDQDKLYQAQVFMPSGDEGAYAQYRKMVDAIGHSLGGIAETFDEFPKGLAAGTEDDALATGKATAMTVWNFADDASVSCRVQPDKSLALSFLSSPTARYEETAIAEFQSDLVTKNYVCMNCGYLYDPVKGDSAGKVTANTPFARLPIHWVCPDCGSGRGEFLDFDLALLLFMGDD
jgi:rubredoxin